ERTIAASKAVPSRAARDGAEMIVMTVSSPSGRTHAGVSTLAAKPSGLRIVHSSGPVCAESPVVKASLPRATIRAAGSSLSPLGLMVQPLRVRVNSRRSRAASRRRTRRLTVVWSTPSSLAARTRVPAWARTWKYLTSSASTPMPAPPQGWVVDSTLTEAVPAAGTSALGTAARHCDGRGPSRPGSRRCDPHGHRLLIGLECFGAVVAAPEPGLAQAAERGGHRAFAVAVDGQSSDPDAVGPPLHGAQILAPHGRGQTVGFVVDRGDGLVSARRAQQLGQRAEDLAASEFAVGGHAFDDRRRVPGPRCRHLGCGVEDLRSLVHRF